MRDTTTSVLVSSSINNNINYIETVLSHSEDLKKRTTTFDNEVVYCFYLDTIVDKSKLEENFLKPISQHKQGSIIDTITSSEVLIFQKLDVLPEYLLKGYAVVFVEGHSNAIVFESKQTSLERSMLEPSNEKVVRGAHDSFTESIDLNIKLIRTRINNTNLAVQYFTLGKETSTRIALMYLKDIANPNLVNEVKRRIKSIDSDSLFTPGFLEEYLEDFPSSPFPQFLNTERPDRAMANIMDGKVLLLSEGDPTGLVLPNSFITFFQSPDDYNSRFLVGSFYRLIRTLGLLISIFVPSIYIATVSFHFETIPAELVLPIKSSIERVPYPPIVEALFMELTIELIREAGIRLPTPIGQTIGIVGGLVIGEAVVRAGLVSNIMIIIVALTAVASFVIPSFEMNSTIRMIRFPFMFAAALLGYIGIAICAFILLAHLCKLESFGSPYLAPFGPVHRKELGDTVVRTPLWQMNKRPKLALPQKLFKQKKPRKWEQDEQNE